LTLDFGVTSGDLGGVEVEEFERLFEGEKVFVAPIAGEGLGDGLLGGLTGGVAQAGQDEWIALSGDDSAEDLKAGGAGDVGEDVVELEVHLLEGLLHVEDVRGTVLDELGAMAEEGP